MKVINTKLKDCVIIEPEIFRDDRGFFMEVFQAEKYSLLAGINLPFVQDNHSHSLSGVLRGLHFQKSNRSQKLMNSIVFHTFSTDYFSEELQLKRIQ